VIGEHDPEWVIMNDVDEFLCPRGDDLTSVLRQAVRDHTTAITVLLQYDRASNIERGTFEVANASD
jgi:hypothetical protein